MCRGNQCRVRHPNRCRPGGVCHGRPGPRGGSLGKTLHRAPPLPRWRRLRRPSCRGCSRWEPGYVFILFSLVGAAAGCLSKMHTISLPLWCTVACGHTSIAWVHAGPKERAEPTSLGRNLVRCSKKRGHRMRCVACCAAPCYTRQGWRWDIAQEDMALAAVGA